MKKLIVVADWANDHLACQEIRSTIEGFVRQPEKLHISFIGSTISTIHTTFLLQQVVNIEERYGRPLETVIFQSTDPRLQTAGMVEEPKGADFLIIRLRSGLYLAGPNSGYDFSLIYKKIDEVFRYPNLEQLSNSRARDVYSKIVAYLLDALEDEMQLEEAPINLVPRLTGYYVGHIDAYKSIKSTIPLSELQKKYSHGDLVKIKINDIERRARFTTNLFNSFPGELVIYSGSAGEKDDPYLDIAVWSFLDTKKKVSSAYSLFNQPQPGLPITID